MMRPFAILEIATIYILSWQELGEKINITLISVSSELDPEVIS